MHPILKRAIVWFLLCAAFGSAIVGALLWYFARLSDPCPANGMLDGRPVTCYYRVQPAGFDDWPWILVALVLGFGVCLLVSWLSSKRRSGAPGEA